MCEKQLSVGIFSFHTTQKYTPGHIFAYRMKLTKVTAQWEINGVTDCLMYPSVRPTKSKWDPCSRDRRKL